MLQDDILRLYGVDIPGVGLAQSTVRASETRPTLVAATNSAPILRESPPLPPNFNRLFTSTSKKSVRGMRTEPVSTRR